MKFSSSLPGATSGFLRLSAIVNEMIRSPGSVPSAVAVTARKPTLAVTATSWMTSSNVPLSVTFSRKNRLARERCDSP